MSSLSDDEIEQHKQKLKQDTEKARQKEQEKRQSLLNSVEQDSQIGNTNTVQFGEIEIRHKAFIPGEQLQKIQSVNRGNAETDDDEIELLCSITESLHDQQTNQTHSDAETIKGFWRTFISQYGTDAYSLIMDRLLSPLIEETEEKMDAINSFQK